MKILLKESDELLLTAQPDEKIRIGDVILSESVLSQVIDIKFLTTNSIEAYILRKSLIPEENTTESIQPEISGMMGTLLDQKLLVTKIRGRLEDENGRRILKTGITDLGLSREKTVPKKISTNELFEILGLNFPDNTIAETLSENKGFDFDPRKLELTLITGKKKSGKSYFAKRLLLRLIESGVFTLVLDVNQEYQRLGLDEHDQPNEYFRNFIVLDPTINDVNGNRRPLRVPLNEITAEDFIDVVEITTQPTQITVFRCWRDLRANGQFDLADVRAWVDGTDPQTGQPNVREEMVRNALDSRIRYAETLRIFGPLDINNIVENLRDGGALILSIGTLPNRLRKKLVKLAETWLRRLTDLNGDVQLHAACLFLEEAQMYADTDNIVDLITRMRHLGVTPVFITNDPTTLPDELYANIDNIVSFLFKNEKELNHVGRTGLLDVNTLSLLKNLEREQCLVIGEFTNGFPLFVKILKQDGVQMRGETRQLLRE